MAGKSVLLLGVGMQGKVALVDLLQSPLVGEVIAVDTSAEAQAYVKSLATRKARFVRMDASTAQVADLMGQVDVVVELLPGGLAFSTARLAVETGVSLVSSMYLHDPQEEDTGRRRERERQLADLHLEAREKGITVLPEFGLDPGIDLVFGMEAVRTLDEVHELLSYGAGIPELSCAANPLRYKFSWSVEGLLRSYARSARVIRGGRPEYIPAREIFSARYTHSLRLDGLEEPLECFPNGDAVHYARLFGIESTVREAGRYTCRWPGHCVLWEAMAGCGLLSNTSVVTPMGEIAPVEFMAALLASQQQFHYGPGERDIALVLVVARGIKDGRPAEATYQLMDRRDPKTGFAAMSRTVGFPVSVGAQMILSGLIEECGLITPMQVPYQPLVDKLRRRGLDIRHALVQ
ncbi:MAG: saccharopine dehydrogenase family protein [Bacillota bacterium]